MLRLSTPGHSRIVQADCFDAVYGGGEANVAVSLANYGDEAYFVTKLPRHEVGQAALCALRRYGVRTDYVARGGERLDAEPADFDFDAIMAGADWFHWSGITPALSAGAARLTELALQAARRHGVTVSVDLNYRKKLWTPEEAQRVMRPLMAYVDVCIGNEEDAALCLGFRPDADVEAGRTDAEGYRDTFRQMAGTFGFKCVASTLRESYSASHNGWKGLAYDGMRFYGSRHYDILPITDRVGAGDAFSAGLIHCLAAGQSPDRALEFAVAASALKHTLPGDFNMVSTEEVERLVQGDASGRVQR